MELAGFVDQPIDLVSQGGKVIAADGDAFFEEMVGIALFLPGIGLITTIGIPLASASDVVSPPGLPTNRSEAAISSSISVVKPSKWNSTPGSLRESEDHIRQAGE